MALRGLFDNGFFGTRSLRKKKNWNKANAPTWLDEFLSVTLRGIQKVNSISINIHGF